MRAAAATLSLAALLALLPMLADAKGGSMRPWLPKTEFRELIVNGERTEIVACLVAATDYVHHDPTFSAIRWDADASDRAIVREHESNGRLTRSIRLTAQMRRRESSLFSDPWHLVELTCEQPEDGVVHVDVRPAGG
jgi:hypothetical protein